MQHTLWSSGAQQEKLQGGQVAKRGKSQAGAFAVVSGGRNGRGRVSRAGLAGLDHLWALGHRSCPWLSGIWPAWAGGQWPQVLAAQEVGGRGEL